MRKRTYSNNSGGRTNSHNPSHTSGGNRGRGGRSNNNSKYSNNRGSAQNHDSDTVNPRQRQQATTNRDKYENMARDAKSSGDRVQMEYYLQYAEHYNRVLNLADEQREKQEAERREKQAEQHAARVASGENEKDDNSSDANASDDKAPAEKAEAKTDDAPKADATEVAEKPKRAPRRKPAPKVQKDTNGDDGAQLEALLPAPKPIAEEA